MPGEDFRFYDDNILFKCARHGCVKQKRAARETESPKNGDYEASSSLWTIPQGNDRDTAVCKTDTGFWQAAIGTYAIIPPMLTNESTTDIRN